MAELQVYMNEERDEITACQLGVFDGWRINVRQPTNQMGGDWGQWIWTPLTRTHKSSTLWHARLE